MNELNKRLQEKIEYGYYFNLSRYIENGFQLFKQYLPGFVAFTILYVLLQMTAENVGGFSTFLFMLVAPALQVGWFYVAHQVHNNEPSEPQDFLRGFQDWGRLMGMYLIMIGVFMLIALPIIAGMGDVFADASEEGTPLNPVEVLSNLPPWALIVFIPMVYLTVAWRWAPLFIIFYKMEAWQALETSRKLIHKKWLILFVFTLLLGVLGGAGEWMRHLGFPVVFAYTLSIFLLPVSACIEYEAFAEVIELNEENKQDISNHLVE